MFGPLMHTVKWLQAEYVIHDHCTAVTAKGTGQQGRTGPQGRIRCGRDSTHRRPCGTYALNPVALCNTQRAVKEIVKRPSEQLSKRPWSNTHVYY